MKKILSVLLCTAMVAMALIGCTNKKPAAENPTTTVKQEQNAETLKFGAGVVMSTPTATDATEDKNGQTAVDVTFAVVSLDKDGKIVACTFDVVQVKAAYTVEGKGVAAEFKSKHELGDAYNMKPSSAIGKEWFEQAKVLETVIVGKTLAEVKALVVDTNKGTDEVVNAGCTIKINTYVAAIEDACKNAKASDVTAAHTLKLTSSVSQSITDATEDKNGTNKVSTTIFASAVDASGKIVAASIDTVDVSATFDTAGKATIDTTKVIKSKKQLGNDYNMKNTSPIKKEWFEQAAVFETACIGKKASDIAGLMVDGYGIDSLKTAGCTIAISEFVKAASK